MKNGERNIGHRLDYSFRFYRKPGLKCYFKLFYGGLAAMLIYKVDPYPPGSLWAEMKKKSKKPTLEEQKKFLRSLPEFYLPFLKPEAKELWWQLRKE